LAGSGGAEEADNTAAPISRTVGQPVSAGRSLYRYFAEMRGIRVLWEREISQSISPIAKTPYALF